MNDQPTPDTVDSSDWPETNDCRGWVLWHTRKLRSGDPYWRPIAAQLAERGVDPLRAILVDLLPKDACLEEGIVVTPDGRVFEFEFDWLHKSRDEGTFTAWRARYPYWGLNPATWEGVSIALQIIQEQASAR